MNYFSLLQWSPHGMTFFSIGFILRLSSSVGACSFLTACLTTIAIDFHDRVSTLYVRYIKCYIDDSWSFFYVITLILLIPWYFWYLDTGHNWNVFWSWNDCWSFNWWISLRGNLPIFVYISLFSISCDYFRWVDSHYHSL